MTLTTPVPASRPPTTTSTPLNWEMSESETSDRSASTTSEPSKLWRNVSQAQASCSTSATGLSPAQRNPCDIPPHPAKRSMKRGEPLTTRPR